MRTTVDIDDAQYAQLKSKAACEQTSVKALIREAVSQALSTGRRQPSPDARRELPAIGTKRSKKLNLNHDRVNELLLS